MDKRTRFELGTEYKIRWLDHFSSENKNSEEAVNHPEVVLTSWGRCVGVTPKYVILAQNWESDISSNNDNIHIIRKEIVEAKEIK